jgi:hypothetical protein
MSFLAQNSQNIFQLIANNFRAFIWILIIGAIAVARIAKFLKEQNEARQRTEARKRAEQEALRTGRALETPHQPVMASASLPPDSENKSAAQRLEELAAQRRAQVEELRRRRAASTAGSNESARATAPSASPVPPRAPSPAYQPAPATVPPTRAQPAGSAPRPTPKPQQAPRPTSRPAREKPAAQVVRQSPPAPVNATPVEIDPGESVVHRLVKEAPAPVETKRQRALTRPAKSEWRRALLYREILSPPLSMREE